MRHFLILTGLLLGSFFVLTAQENYTMYENTYLMVKPDAMEEFSNAMTTHNKDFHSGNNPYHANVWMVTSGKYAGSVVWSMGPCTFSHLDARPDSEEHNEDWVKNVMPNVQKMGENGYWKRADKLSYAPEDSIFTKLLITVYDIEDWQMYRFKEIAGKVAEVYRAKKYDHSFAVYMPALDMPHERDAAIVWGFRKYADFDEDTKFKEAFDEVHGEGAWDKVLDEYKDIVVNSIDEIWELSPEMSGSFE